MARSFKYLMAAILFPCLLVACSKKHAPPAARAQVAASAPARLAVAEAPPTPSREWRAMMELLHAAHGERASYSDWGALAYLPEPEKRSEESLFYIEPVAMRELSNGWTALVVNGQRADKDGAVTPIDGFGGWLSVYLLKKEQDGWKLVRFQENVAILGASGHIGSEIEWPELGAARPGLAIAYRAGVEAWRQKLAIFDLTAEEMTNLAESIPLRWNNVGNCNDQADECLNVAGTWHFSDHAEGAYPDLVIDFDGYRGEKRVSATAVYQFSGDNYRLTSGENMADQG